MTKRRQALISAVGDATQAYQRAVDGFDDVVGRRLGLNRTDLRSLDWLTVRDMTAGELGQATGLSGAATTSLVDRLERKGYVRRVRDTVDRRRVLVGLTPVARERLGELYGPFAREGRELLDGYSDEQLTMMLEFLERATAIVDRRRDRIRSGSMEGPSA